MRTIFPLIVLYNFVTSSLSLTEVQRSSMIMATFELVRHEMKGKGKLRLTQQIIICFR